MLAIFASLDGEIMECRVSWTGGAGGRSAMSFVAETGTGHVVAMDGAVDAQQPELSGANLAPRPMELLLAGLGGCSAYDVVMILKRGRHAIDTCTVQISSERADADPKVFTKIHMHFRVSGLRLNQRAVERAVALSHEKYCSASVMLSKTASISVSVEVVDSAVSGEGSSH